MQIALIGAALAIVLFLCLYLGFRQGLRLGMQAAKGQIPPKLRNPVEVIKDIIPPKPDPATTELLKGYANMMAFNGELPERKV